MEVTSLSHHRDRGWSIPLPSELDSARTLVLAFGDRLRRTNRGLGRARPRVRPSHRLGCSSAGEILGQTVAEGSLVLAVVRFEHATVTSTAAPIQAVEVSAQPAARSRGHSRPTHPSWSSCFRRPARQWHRPRPRTRRRPPGRDGDRRRTGRRRRPFRADLDAGRRPAAQRLGERRRARRTDRGRPRLRRRMAGVRPGARGDRVRRQRALRARRQARACALQGLPGRSRGRVARDGALLPAGDPHARGATGRASCAPCSASTRRRSR